MLMIERYSTKNPKFEYLGYTYHQLNFRKLLSSIFGHSIVEPTMYLINNPQSLLKPTMLRTTKTNEYIGVVRGELLLLAFLMRLSGIAFSKISETFDNIGAYLGTRQNIEQTLKNINEENLFGNAISSSHLLKLITRLHKRPTFDYFSDNIYESLNLHTLGRLIELLRITNIKPELLFDKYLTHYDNCTKRRARRKKLLKLIAQGHDPLEFDDQDRTLLKKEQPKSKISPLDFVIIIVVNISLRKNKDFQQLLNFVCSRQEDVGHYLLTNTILDSQSQNSTYARLLEKEKKIKGFSTLDIYESDREKLDMIRTIFDYVIEYQKQVIEEPNNLLKHIEILIENNQPLLLRNEKTNNLLIQ